MMGKSGSQNNSGVLSSFFQVANCSNNNSESNQGNLQLNPQGLKEPLGTIPEGPTAEKQQQCTILMPNKGLSSMENNDDKMQKSNCSIFWQQYNHRSINYLIQFSLIIFTTIHLFLLIQSAFKMKWVNSGRPLGVLKIDFVSVKDKFQEISQINRNSAENANFEWMGFYWKINQWLIMR